jgi:hypothetical protein
LVKYFPFHVEEIGGKGAKIGVHRQKRKAFAGWVLMPCKTLTASKSGRKL